MSSETWARYNCIDSAVSVKILDEIEPDIDSQDYRKLYDETISLFEPIIFMQTVGLNVDHEALKEEKAQVEKDIAEAEKALWDICGFELNSNSPKQCQRYFYGILGHSPYTSGKGRPTTDDKAMARLSRKGVKEAKYVQSIRGLRKLLGTYYEVTTDPDGMLRASFNPRGTSTGRLSSSQNIFNTGLNFQNIDPRFKRFIKAAPDRFFLSLDKAQAEWVITAYVCNDPKMIYAVESNLDIHAQTAHEMTGIPISLIKKEQELIGHLTDPDEIFEIRCNEIPEFISKTDEWNFLPRSMTVRQCGKKSNHGLNYMEGYYRFALENEIPEKEAKIYVDAYPAIYVNLPIYWEKVAAKLAKDRILHNCFGHPRRFLGEHGRDLTKQGVAYIPQSTSVWVLNYAMRKWYDDNSDIMNKAWLHAQVHDELLFSFPMDSYNQVGHFIHQMNEYMSPTISYEGREFSIKTDLAVGKCWAEYSQETQDGIKKVNINQSPDDLAQEIEGVITNMV